MIMRNRRTSLLLMGCFSSVSDRIIDLCGGKTGMAVGPSDAHAKVGHGQAFGHCLAFVCVWGCQGLMDLMSALNFLCSQDVFELVCTS